MYLEVYIDIVFIINLIMDYIILFIVKVLTKRNTKKIRLFLGAVVGALMMCMIVILPYDNYFFNVVVGYLLTSVLLIYISFKPKILSEFIKLTIIMYLSAIMLGGIMFALYYYSSIGVAVSKVINGTYNMDLGVGLFVIFGIIAIIIFKIIRKVMANTVMTNKNLYGVEININDSKIMVNGLLDTGNNLYDPITKNPVLIAETELLKKLIEKDSYDKLRDISCDVYNLSSFAEFGEKSNLKLRLIPFSSLGNENGMLLGIVADNICINLGNETKDYRDVVVAVYDKKLSNDNSYQVLIHPKLISVH
ncbi:sporulation sigma-E factor-processing peptidase [Vallitalea longa]|uniref:Sporulation sigma-E factor-processing peptidase n=1 Tax=Vallitalea longa TaxID=2936439 RepID=A0A9W6DDL6_9FIRM|nr:sigma-E processing peptidase SpoIIGA [Vallitalea longa]GKX29071.1 sporulation sigma-E factor-processing peptidase [Vallitalea longa]